MLDAALEFRASGPGADHDLFFTHDGDVAGRMEKNGRGAALTLPALTELNSSPILHLFLGSCASAVVWLHFAFSSDPSNYGIPLFL